MTIRIFPFAEGDGRNVSEDDWRLLNGIWQRGYGVIPPGDLYYGVGDALKMTDASSGSNYIVQVAPGAAWMAGHMFVSDATEEFTIGAPGDRKAVVFLLRANLDTRTASIVTVEKDFYDCSCRPAVTRTSSIREIVIGCAKINDDPEEMTIYDARVGVRDEWILQRDTDILVTAGNHERVRLEEVTKGNYCYAITPPFEFVFLESGLYYVHAELKLTGAAEHEAYLIFSHYHEDGSVTRRHIGLYHGTEQTSVFDTIFLAGRRDWIVLYVEAVDDLAIDSHTLHVVRIA